MGCIWIETQNKTWILAFTSMWIPWYRCRYARSLTKCRDWLNNILKFSLPKEWYDVADEKIKVRPSNNHWLLKHLNTIVRQNIFLMQPKTFIQLLPSIMNELLNCYCRIHPTSWVDVCIEWEQLNRTMRWLNIYFLF